MYLKKIIKIKCNLFVDITVTFYNDYFYLLSFFFSDLTITFILFL